MPRLSDLLLDIGRAKAQGELGAGAAWGQGVSTLGQLVGGIPQQMQAQRESEQTRHLRDAQLQSEQAQLAGAQRQAADVTAMDEAAGSGLDPEAIEAALPGHLRMSFRKSWNDAEAAKVTLSTAKTKAQEAEADYFGSLAAGVKPFLGGEDGGVGAAQIAIKHAKAAGFDTQELEHALQRNPQALPQLIDGLIAKSPKYSEMGIKTDDLALRRTTEERALATANATSANLAADNRRADAAAVEVARHNKEQERIATMTAGRTEAAAAETRRHNLATEENARNTKIGRPVIAGDAEDLAAIDEGLKLSRGLNFKQGDTGIVPSVSGHLPDFVTNLTGVGVEAKSRQGVINLTKQIIGKGLEGGVLRKEDESKYEKILPTLSDHPGVVEAKIKSLIKTLEQKRGVRLDALDDAGYNVSKFRARTPGPPADTKAGGAPTADDLIRKYGN